ncbi:MAG: hypothetical protein RIS24_242 [Verrucomicrobiota bacterium]
MRLFARSVALTVLMGCWMGFLPATKASDSIQEAPVPLLASEWGVGRWVPDLDFSPESSP